MRRSPARSLVSTLLAAVIAALSSASTLHAQAAEPPSSPPAHWGPVSINMEDVPYPHPVSFLEQELFGQVVRLAYMDVAPAGPANGRTVVLLHGGSYYSWYWRHTIEALRNEGYRVVAVDRLGWGRSSKPILPYSLNLFAANTKAILDHLGISEVAVVGHSIGGQDASRFAFVYPETTTHFVMVNPVGITDSRSGREWREPSWGGGTPDMQQVYESILRREYTRVGEWKPELLEHVRISYGQYLSGEWPRLSHVRSLAGSARSMDTVVHDWPLMETKGAIIAGADDGPSFPAQARAAVDAMQNGELVLFPNVGHNPHEEVPELFNAELIRFLATDPDEPAGEDGR
jgi:pimeloyl-ACP methyl ester carboxylesterase